MNISQIMVCENGTDHIVYLVVQNFHFKKYLLELIFVIYLVKCNGKF